MVPIFGRAASAVSCSMQGCKATEFSPGMQGFWSLPTVGDKSGHSAHPGHYVKESCESYPQVINSGSEARSY
jgi:hypothetical protein